MHTDWTVGSYTAKRILSSLERRTEELRKRTRGITDFSSKEVTTPMEVLIKPENY